MNNDRNPILFPLCATRLLAAAVVMAALAPTPAQANTDGDTERRVAARALFGEGITRTRDDANKTITLDYDPEVLDEAKLRRFTRKYYNATAERNMTSWATGPAGLSVWGYSIERLWRDGSDAWVINDPYYRGLLCAEIARGLSNKSEAQELVEWCEYSAVLEARANQFEFRGKRVKLPLLMKYEGTLGAKGTAWPNDEPLLIVRGFHKLNDMYRVRAQTRMAKLVPKTSRYYERVRKIIDENEKILSKLRAAAAKKKKRYKRRGIVWSDAWFDELDMPDTKTKADCGDLTYLGFRPKRGYYEWELSVDGATCQSGQFHSNKTIRGRVYTGTKNSCSAELLPTGPHRVELSIYPVRYRKTGDVEVRRTGKGLTARHREVGKRGKRAAHSKFRCVTKGQSLREHYRTSQR